MSGEVIQSFLVGLGFDVDEKSLGAFNKSIKDAAIRVTALYASISAAATGIAAGIASISQGFEDMGYELRLVAPVMNRWLVTRQAMLQAYSKAGVNLGETVSQAIKFNYALEKMKFTLEAVYKSVAAKFFPILTKQLDVFRLKIYANMPKIQSALKGFVDGVFKAFDILIQLGERIWSILTRVYDFFEKLDKATGGWSTTVLAMIAVWKALNLSFLATPLGMVLAGLLAIVALYDDFKVWQEGGKSFFDWASESARYIYGLIVEVTALVGVFYLLKTAYLLYQNQAKIAAAAQAVWNTVLAIFTGELEAAAVAAAVLEAPLWLIVGAATALVAVLNFLDKRFGLFGNKGVGFVNVLGDKVADTFGISKNTPNIAGGPGGQQNPLLPGNSSTRNVDINQTNSFTINGSPDPHATGRAVRSEQNQVNLDLVQNSSGNIQ